MEGQVATENAARLADVIRESASPDALTGAGMVAYAKRTVAQINRISLDRGAITPVEDLPPGEPQNFLLVGVEIKREVVHGELRDPRAVVLPVIAALGGMIVPAAIYASLNAGGAGSNGWAVPMA